MFEVGWSEMLVIAIVMIVVVGPKDLPNMLRTMGRMTAKLRGMAGDFQRQFNEALKEAELEDVKKSVDSLRSLNPMTEIRKQLNPFEQAAQDVRSGLDRAMKPKPAETDVPKADDAAQPAEPLKNGAAALPEALETPPPALQNPPAEPVAAAASSTARKGRAAKATTASKAEAPVKTEAPATKAAARGGRSAAAKVTEAKAPAKSASAGPAKAPAAGRKASAAKVAEKAGKREAKGTPK